jgi:hypothetical protein
VVGSCGVVLIVGITFYIRCDLGRGKNKVDDAVYIAMRGNSGGFPIANVCQIMLVHYVFKIVVI